jgi:hypothetical protein
MPHKRRLDDPARRLDRRHRHAAGDVRVDTEGASRITHRSLLDCKTGGGYSAQRPTVQHHIDGAGARRSCCTVAALHCPRGACRDVGSPRDGARMGFPRARHGTTRIRTARVRGDAPARLPGHPSPIGLRRDPGSRLVSQCTPTGAGGGAARKRQGRPPMWVLPLAGRTRAA